MEGDAPVAQSMMLTQKFCRFLFQRFILEIKLHFQPLLDACCKICGRTKLSVTNEMEFMDFVIK